MFDLIKAVGFTGTQQGMNNHQRRRFRRLILELNPTEFHHGDCIGADEQAQAIVRELVPQCRLVIHPPSDPSKRAFCKADEVLPAKPYLKRNLDIVRRCSIMVATPYEVEEQLRSGTWSTVRYARRAIEQEPSRTLHLILPKEMK